MITTHSNKHNRFFNPQDSLSIVDALNSTETPKSEGGGASDTMKTNSRSLRSTLLKGGLMLGLSALPVITTAEIALGQQVVSEEPIAQQVESAPNPNSVPTVPGQANQLGGTQAINQSQQQYYQPSQSFQSNSIILQRTGIAGFVKTGANGGLEVGVAGAFYPGEMQEIKNRKDQDQKKLELDKTNKARESADQRLNRSLDLCKTMGSDEAKQKCSDKANDRFEADKIMLPDRSKIPILPKP